MKGFLKKLVYINLVVHNALEFIKELKCEIVFEKLVKELIPTVDSKSKV